MVIMIISQVGLSKYLVADRNRSAPSKRDQSKKSKANFKIQPAKKIFKVFD